MEIFHETAQTRDGSYSTGLNVGGIWDIDDNCHFLASAGQTVQGRSSFIAYAALQFTFGPQHEAAGVTH